MEELLINKVKEREFLFDVKSPSYKDRNVRQEAWEEIGRELNMKPEVVKEKWLKLRRCFTNALNRRRWKQSNQAAKKIASWKFGKQMSFLLPHLDTRKTHSNLEESPLDCKQEVDSKQSDDEEHEHEEVEYENDKGDSDNASQDLKNLNAVQQNLDNREIKKRITEKDENPLFRILSENVGLQQLLFQEKNFKHPNMPDIGEFDESDMFYLSMSKMAKRLPLVSQAKIKLLLSQAVLEAEITNAGKQIENVMANLSASFLPTSETQSTSLGGGNH